MYAKGLCTSVGTFLFLETTALFKSLSTFSACKGSLLCKSFHASSKISCVQMSFHMFCINDSSPVFVFQSEFETTTLFKCLSTFSVWKWLLSCVGPFVLLQTLAVFKCLNTCFAWKWFLSSVCPFMLLQISAAFKCIYTCDVCKQLLTSVGTFVFLETTVLF